MRNYCLINFLFVGIGFISQNASAKEPKPEVVPRAFTYVDESKWGNLDPSYKLCSTGTQQSPINIICKQAVENKNLSPLMTDYQITNVTLESNGLAAYLRVKGKTQVTVDGKVYKLLNLRWHLPAEHVIDNVKEAAEMQQVFVDTEGSGNMVIIATIYRLGGPDPIIASLGEELSKVSKLVSTGKGLWAADVSMDRFSSDKLAHIPTKKYVKYMGSLTAPPCTENVIWFVITEPQPITSPQLTQITSLQTNQNHNNARPVKPLNGRVVEATA